MDQKNSKEIICQLLREFYQKGWCSGSGGGISVRESDDCVYVAPSGVLKEYVQENEIYKIDINGDVVENPTSRNKLKPSECTPLFNAMYRLKRAGAAIHSHSLNATLVTKLYDQEVDVIDFEMIKGITGHKNSEFCIIPIIENTERECELTYRLEAALLAYPRAYGILVRNHGLYVFGQNWQKAKIHAECYDYLFNALLELRKLGIKPKECPNKSSAIKAWFLNQEQIDADQKEGNLDLRNIYQYAQYKWVNQKDFEKLGLNIASYDQTQNGSTGNQETISCVQSEANYKEILEKLQTPQTTQKEETRVILNGGGYLDIQNNKKEWVRVQIQKEQEITLKSGITYRLTTDIRNELQFKLL